jgi:signal transduction histidine kinase
MVGIHTPVWQEVTNIFDEVVRALPLSGITVQSETAGLWVYADPLMIRVFSNFIDNSLRHGGEISWISLSWEYSGEELLLIYQDNGIGIPESIEPGKTKTLGLELIQGLVHQLNGTMTLDRSNGTKYTLRFSA